MKILLNKELVGWAEVVYIKTGEGERKLRKHYFCWKHYEAGRIDSMVL